MRSFSEFVELTERASGSISSQAVASGGEAVESDDPGKSFECKVLKKIHPTENPSDFRAKSENKQHAGSPKEVEKKLDTKLGPEISKRIDGDATASVSALKAHLTKTGILGGRRGVRIADAHWTSNPGDIKKLTGEHDPNSNADVTLTLQDKNGKHVGFHGISLKHGAQKPNYRNPGIADIEKITGAKTGSVQKHWDAHNERMSSELGYEGPADKRHAQYKADILPIETIRNKHAKLQESVDAGKKLDPKNRYLHEELSSHIAKYDSLKSQKSKDAYVSKRKARAAMAVASDQQARTSMAKEAAKSLISSTAPTVNGKKIPLTKPDHGHDDSALRNFIRQRISPPTNFPHTTVHAQLRPDGSTRVHVTPSDQIADQHMDNFKDLHVVHSTSRVIVKGRHKVTGQIQNVMTLAIKKSSGPNKGSNGTVKLA
jgi:hypothetical protein